MLLRIVLISRPSTAPYPFIIFVLSALISAFFDILHATISPSHLDMWLLAIITTRILDCTFLLIICATFPIQNIQPSPQVASVGSKPSQAYSSPEDSVSLWNWLTFDYIEPLFRVADQGTLEDSDVWDLPPTFKHANLFRKYIKTQAYVLRFLLTTRRPPLH